MINKGSIIGYIIVTLFIAIISFCVINAVGLGAAFISEFGIVTLIASIMLGSAVGIFLFKKFIHLFE